MTQHYRIIHADDGKAALHGQPVRTVATMVTMYELTAVQAQVALSQFVREHTCLFPVLMVDSIGVPVATDARNWAHRLGVIHTHDCAIGIIAANNCTLGEKA